MNEIRCGIELRADDTGASPGRLYGTLLTYAQQAMDRAELFEKDSLVWADDGIVINRQHARNWPVLRAVPEVRGLAVMIDCPLPDTIAGRDAASEILSRFAQRPFCGIQVASSTIRQRYKTHLCCKAHSGGSSGFTQL